MEDIRYQSDIRYQMTRSIAMRVRGREGHQCPGMVDGGWKMENGWMDGWVEDVSVLNDLVFERVCV